MGKVMLGVAAATLTVALGACAHSTAQGGAEFSGPSGERGHWTGVIRARPSRTGEATPTKPTAAYQGSVRMTQWENDTSHTGIYIRLSTPEGNHSVSWVLASGPCGAIESPVLPISSFDPLQLGSDGRGETRTHVPFLFPTDGSYHIDFFSGNSARLTEVVACAALKFHAD